jgi:hypothetical protein
LRDLNIKYIFKVYKTSGGVLLPLHAPDLQAFCSGTNSGFPEGFVSVQR